MNSIRRGSESKHPTRKENVKDDSAATTIEPFRVCTDVEPGPLLPRNSPDRIRETWSRIEKNRTTGDPAKTKGDPRLFRNRNDNPQDEPDRFGVLEACSDLPPEIEDDKTRARNLVYFDFNSVNLLAKAVHVAFYEHYPLRLSPDVIWLTIVQGLAKHVDKDPERQRRNFVRFDGKKEIAVVRSDFVKGSPENDWTAVFPEFADKIAEYIGTEKAAALTCDFTTSTPTDRICSHIALMDTVKHYFEYRMLCGCGIPSIELTGTPQDWVDLRQKAEVLKDVEDLGWWTSELFVALDHFVAAAEGNPDVKFWRSICNVHGGSGFWSNFVTGWIQVFSPYSNGGNRCNDSIAQWRNCYEQGTGRETEEYNNGLARGKSSSRGAPFDYVGYGMKLETIPVGVSQAPFTYTDMMNMKSYSMAFNGGVVAVLQDKETKALEPVSGWSVLDHGEIEPEGKGAENRAEETQGQRKHEG